MDDALLAGDSLGQEDLVVERGLLAYLLRDLVLGRGGVGGQVERVLVHALLGDDVLLALGGAQLQLKVAPVVRGQVNLDFDFLTRKK